MARPLALVGFSAYAALAWAAAWGPESARPLAVLCLLLALVCGGALLGLRVRGQNRKKKRQQELPAEQPGALRAFCGAFLALLAGGAVLLSYSAAWEKAVLPQSLDGRELQVRAQVLDYPQERYHRLYYRLQVEGLWEEEGEPVETSPFTLRLSSSLPLACEPGDWVVCQVAFSAFEREGGLFSTANSRLADGFQGGGFLSQYEGIQVEKDPATPLWELLARFRHQLGRELNRRLPQREAGLLRAMVLGDSGGLWEEDRGNFQKLGVSHILVVSGLHMTVLASFLQLLLRRFGGAKWAGNLLTGLVLLLFLALTGFSPSACRGAAMYGVLLLADSFGRAADSLNSLGLAVLLVCAVDPFSGGDVGFALSVLATLGIVVAYLPFYQALLGAKGDRRGKIWKGIAGSLAVTGAATLGTFPVQLAAFRGISLLMPLANLVLVFPSTLLLYLGFCGMVFLPIPALAPLGTPFLWVGGWASRLFLQAGSLLAQGKGVYGAVDAGSSLVLVLGLLLLAFCALLTGLWEAKRPALRRGILGGMAAAVVLFAGVLPWAQQRQNYVLVAPETDGASCVVLLSGNRAAVLSLGGYRTGAVAQLLHRRNVTQVETLCLPDTGPDALEAASQILREYPVEQLVLPSGAYWDRNLEESPAPVYAQAGTAVEVLPGVQAEILPRWEGLRLQLHGVDVLVEWEAAKAQSCEILFTCLEESRVNSTFTVWQTDGIIEETTSFPQEGETWMLPVEEGAFGVELQPGGEYRVRREG